MNKNLFLLLLLTILFTSCGNEIINEPKDTQKVEIIKFVYKGVSYSSTYSIINNNIIWGNKETEELYLKLENLPNSATLVHEDGSLEFFDTFNDLSSQMLPNSKDNNEISLRSYVDAYSFGDAYLTLYLYEHQDRAGRVCTWNARKWDASDLTVELPELMPLRTPSTKIQFNDILTSFEVVMNKERFNCLYELGITLFEHVDFGGKSITFTQRTTDNILYIRDLTNYTMSGGFIGIGKKSWDNEVSSLKYWGRSVY